MSERSRLRHQQRKEQIGSRDETEYFFNSPACGSALRAFNHAFRAAGITEADLNRAYVLQDKYAAARIEQFATPNAYGVIRK